MNTHDSWEQIHKTKEWGAYPSEHIIRFIARNYYNVEDRKKVKILDFGSGTGAHTWYLAREGFDTWAFDISETAIMRLKKRMEHENLPVHAEVCDGLNVSYETGFFDAVIDNVSIISNRIDDIKKMYKTSYRILKSGGKLITVCFEPETTGYGTGVKIEDGTDGNITTGCIQGLGGRHFFTQSELRQVLEESGFKNICIEFIKYSDRGSIVSQLVAVGEK